MIKLLLLSLLALSVSGCLRTRSQIQNRGAVTSTAPQQQQAQTAPAPGPRAVRATQPQRSRAIVAGQANQLSEVQNLLRELMGRIEVLEKNWQTTQGNQEVDQMRTQISGKLVLYEQALVRLEKQVNQMSGKGSGTLRTAATTKGVAPQKLSSFDLAEQKFNKKDWRKAILGYQEFREKNPKSKNYPEATYKIGVCFQELGMKKEGKAFYNEVVAKFPKSRTAKKAKYRLSKIK